MGRSYGALALTGAQTWLPSRAALYLFVVEGRSHREVADVLDVSETAARAKVSRALKRLRVQEAEEVHRGDA